jgi:hypothetical protein
MVQVKAGKADFRPSYIRMKYISGHPPVKYWGGARITELGLEGYYHRPNALKSS